MHIWVSNLTIIGSDNGLSPGRCQAIIWTIPGILFIRPRWTNFSESLIEILTFSFKKMGLKLLTAKWRPFRLNLNVLIWPPEIIVLQFPSIDKRVSESMIINSLGPSDSIWCWRSWSTLVQVMACCLTAPSHYLNQCWLLISKVLWHSSENIIMKDLKIPNIKAKLKIIFSRSY